MFLLCFLSIYSQDHYRVFLTDKEGSTFEPKDYFDQKAIDRRMKTGLDLYDLTDYPISPNYLDRIDSEVNEITGHSRWFNVIFCNAYESEILKIQELDFVKSIEKIEIDSPGMESLSHKAKLDSLFDDEELELRIGQVAIHEMDKFRSNNLTGKGIKIAVFDVGFKDIDQSPHLKHLFRNGQIKEGWDFVRNKELRYDKNGSHGAMVLSCIAGIYNEMPFGMATDADFYLARTERGLTEFISEEENWLQAAEWADKNGVDIINSSLGYTSNRYYQSDLDGKTTFVTKAANFAASKGILVVNSAGNDGSSYWETLGAPADADSVLSVGGILSYTGIHSNWSSYGPTADRRMKPNVSAYGNVMAVKGDKYELSETQGTSFSSPLVAGFAACAWQSNPSWTNMELFEEIEKSGHLYPYFDYAHGHGVPKASYFTNKESKVDTTFDVTLKADILYAIARDEFITKTEVDSVTWGLPSTINLLKKEQDKLFDNYMYCHLEKPNGVLSRYFVNYVDESGDGAEIYLPSLSGYIIRIHYRGYTYEYENN